MPPEALNDNKYSFKSDIWALGVIFFEMITGKTPWRAKTQKQLGKQLLSVPIDKLLPKGIHQSSIDFLLRTLVVDINQRMGPEQLSQFSFFMQKTDKQSTKGDLVSTNSISDARSFLLKSSKRDQTSLNRNTIETPKNIKRFNFLKNSTNQNVKNTSSSLQKTQYPNSAFNKTQCLISTTSNQNIIQSTSSNFNTTHKQLSNFRSNNNIAPTIIDKKLLSKQLLSQVHFCRFLYKLLMRIQGKLSNQINQKFSYMKDLMTGLIFQRLNDINNLKLLTGIQKKQYKQTSDYIKITQIVNQYQTKYSKDLGHINKKSQPLQTARRQISTQIIYLHNLIQGQPCNQVKQQVIVVDYLITLRQLLYILQEDNLQVFHNKSKIENIVQGNPASNITNDHVFAITSKLRTLKML